LGSSPSRFLLSQHSPERPCVVQRRIQFVKREETIASFCLVLHYLFTPNTPHRSHHVSSLTRVLASTHTTQDTWPARESLKHRGIEGGSKESNCQVWTTAPCDSLSILFFLFLSRVKAFLLVCLSERVQDFFAPSITLWVQLIPLPSFAASSQHPIPRPIVSLIHSVDLLNDFLVWSTVCCWPSFTSSDPRWLTKTVDGDSCDLCGPCVA
jgi:hypothetical protein